MTRGSCEDNVCCEGGVPSTVDRRDLRLGLSVNDLLLLAGCCCSDCLDDEAAVDDERDEIETGVVDSDDEQPGAYVDSSFNNVGSELNN